MGDDLDTRLAQAAVRSLLPKSISLPMASTARRTSTPAATLSASAVEECLPDVAGLVAVDQQVDVVGGRRDIVEHPREVRRPWRRGSTDVAIAGA